MSVNYSDNFKGPFVLYFAPHSVRQLTDTPLPVWEEEGVKEFRRVGDEALRRLHAYKPVASPLKSW